MKKNRFGLQHGSSPVKLKNLGNTCYLNSALQLLASCHIFARRLSDIESISGVLPVRPFPSRDDRRVDLKRRIVYEIQRVIHILNHGNKEQISSIKKLKFEKLEIVEDDKETLFFSPYKLRFLFSRIIQRARILHHFRLYQLNRNLGC